jgi:pimeloyl-ACP methyl ester carboxylesterase
MTAPPDAIPTTDRRALAAWRLGASPHRVIVPNGAVYAGDFADLWTRHGALVYDLRNRGASAAVSDPAELAGGVRHDLTDLEAVRAAAGIEQAVLVGHSYVAELVLHYAAAHPDRVAGVISLGPTGYAVGRGGPPPPDEVAVDVLARLTEFMRTPYPGDDEARCRAAWALLAPLYVADPVHAPRIEAWGRCEQANERASLAYWLRYVEPSLRAASVSAAHLARITCPVLVVHGDRDRSAPYAAGQAWVAHLPNARLLTVRGAAHAPWIEAPGTVVPALRRFLDGEWPADAVRLSAS